ncbi:tetraketide alpha-pyrone reductase 1 [Nymphaea colorata]|nr:tetraketide alpha-pyrone reductase 1 [Nymphaea colorata]
MAGNSIVTLDEEGKDAVGNTGKRVCVTGASGYVASWLVKRLLHSGYTVVGTVRDPGNKNKTEHLWRLEGAKERLKLVGANLMEEGSFDEAIVGCEAVFHTASPVLAAKVIDPKAEILEPAVQGTLNVLRSCNRNPALKRVVLTSSTAAVRARDDFDPSTPLDESSWSSTQLCERLQIWYALSKTLAERAAWDYAEKNKIDLITVLPAFVIGPTLPRHLCSTASDVLAFLTGGGEKMWRHGRMGYVHIDDVARCHILVLEDAEARGRYLCCSTVLETEEFASIFAARFPSLPIPTKFENMQKGGLYYDYDMSKLRSLGFNFKGMEEMFDDCVQSLRQHGYLADAI